MNLPPNSVWALAAAERADAEAGMSWWNSLTALERAWWLALANSATPAEAWAAYKADPSRGPDC
jgi:hypothetical protein